ncbi:DUF982 domain-containing protein [Agrobacterium rosae]
MTSRDIWFRIPVRITLQNGLEKTFWTVYEALDFLQNEWPRRRGNYYKQAVMKCSAALSCFESSEVAREAFMVACIEASMLIVIPTPIPARPQEASTQANVLAS